MAEWTRFYFETIFFSVEAQCNEHVPPLSDNPEELLGMAGQVKAKCALIFIMLG
ncbi:hypothetical protein NJH54_10200 [Pseudomonas asiatica]|uniref:hypothetical protein n=1 Tax=Pseudomonas asiatica TaxID=2219225 RepID=UPI00209B3C18|nr:hypothetical protein [Pseudomonas asiatica]MCO7524884.1 hypothetical protein [Pseudomonas asiatica]